MNNKPLIQLNERQLKVVNDIGRKIENGTYTFEEIPCAVCNGADFELLSERDRFGLYLSTVICKQCGLIQSNPRMTQNSYNQFYNNEFTALYRNAEIPSRKYFERQYERGARIFTFLKNQAIFESWTDKSVLEIGCGAGGILKYFKDKGCRVKGIDLGEKYIEFGRTEYDLDLLVSTTGALDESFRPDLVIYSHVLEHILDPNEELQSVNNLLKDSGFLFIDVPGVKNLKNSFKMNLILYLQNSHVYHFTLNSLQNLLQKNGFSLIVGNEVISSLFRKCRDRSKAKGFTSDYSQVKSYLRETEKIRNRYPIPPYIIRDLYKSGRKKILEKLGIYRFLKTLQRNYFFFPKNEKK